MLHFFALSEPLHTRLFIPHDERLASSEDNHFWPTDWVDEADKGTDAVSLSCLLDHNSIHLYGHGRKTSYLLYKGNPSARKLLPTVLLVALLTAPIWLKLFLKSYLMIDLTALWEKLKAGDMYQYPHPDWDYSIRLSQICLDSFPLCIILFFPQKWLHGCWICHVCNLT